MAETAAQRYARDWAQIQDDRIERGLDEQDEARLKRLYVDDPQGDYMDNETPALPDHEDHTA
jgi:hypothetical protein